MRTSSLLFASLVSLVRAECAAEDSCLQALISAQPPSRLGDTQGFCSSYTKDESVAIPAYAVDACRENQNAGQQVRLVNACACVAAAAPAAPTPTSPAVLGDTASPSVTTPASPIDSTPTDACALVSASSAAQKSAAPSAVPTVAAKLALDCLSSVPLNKTAGVELVDAIVPYLEWQSDLAWKKDPPEDYPFPPHDILASLAEVKSSLEQDSFDNEYEFQAALYQVFARGHDGHFIFYPDALTKAFDWARTRALVSISEDGSSLPVIKIYEDLINNPKTASVVTEINGVDAAKYVSEWVNTATLNQDVDAAYNTMFYEKAFAAQGSPGFFRLGGRHRFIYPGPNTTYAFANGSSFVAENVARVRGNFAGITNGEQFYQRFCTGPLGMMTPGGNAQTLSVDPAAAAKPTVDAAVLVPGYPPPVIATNDSIATGYYLDGDGYRDVAVLSLLAFESQSVIEFQAVTQQFFAAAKKDGKTKLVIDLSANGGGYILLGYDLFRQLFPTIVQDGNSRWRENDAFNAISKIFSAASADFNPNTATAAQINQQQSWFNYRYDLNISNENFESFGDKFGPFERRGDNFTNLMRWNLSDPLTTRNATFGIGTDVTGYGARANFTQPFDAANIVLLQDGFCASTCTIFSEFMRTLGGVSNIAIGGRPKAGPMQGVGGVKGSQVLGWTDIYTEAQLALTDANVSASQAAALRRLTPLPLIRSVAASANVRDSILAENIDDGTPSQYIREEANCRLYYTQPMITDVTATWKAAADAAFNGKPCVYGGFERLDSTSTPMPAMPNKKPVLTPGQVMRVSASAPEPPKDDAWLARHLHKVIY